ncbi:ArnT family glycosyltransferase [Comamonas sp. J-3]|uniref:ArnT family glycosyltransferase n=1 Tax=Comamonas trifloxystrobinivorans TaxID=3350256 RepID=UPI00372CD76F
MSVFPFSRPDERRAPWLWIAALALLVVVTRMLMSPAVSWDQNEQLVWSQELALGYGPQPPLYTWLQWALNLVLGPSTLSVVLLKNLLIALSFVFMLLAARQVLPARTAWLAAAGMACLPGIGWQLLRDQTHTVMLTCAICATWWLVLRQLRAPTPIGFVWIGLAAAWGMLSKYSYLMVVLALLGAALSLPATRRALLSKGWWLAPLIGVLLVAPHAWWVLEHWQQASSATLNKLQPAQTVSRWHGLATGSGFLLSFLALAVLPWLAVAALSFGKFWRAPRGDDAACTPAWLLPLLKRYVLLVALGLALVVLGGASKLDGRWIQPLLLVVPLWLLARWPAMGSNSACARRYLRICLFLFLLVWSVALYAPLHKARAGHADRLNWPLEQIGATLQHGGFQGQGVVIAEHHTTAGVLRLLFPQARIVVCDMLLASADGCVAQSMQKARAQRQMVLLITSDDPAPDSWWRASTTDRSVPATTEVRLPFRWTDPAKAALILEYFVTDTAQP